jgi:prepilin-type N-terminal cleavage/methylation domain-containing protein
MRRTNAFTLIEVLVVVSIIGLLAAILVPSLAKARTQARRVTCATQLHQVGLAMVAYMQDNGDRMPYASFMPSLGPAPLTGPTIWFADVLKRSLKSPKALECPEDKPNFSDREAPNTGLSYFQSERSSYAYRLRLAGLTPAQFGSATGGFHHHQGEEERDRQKKIPSNTIWFANDYNNFHGKAGQLGARRYVYIDGHVSDFEN